MRAVIACIGRLWFGLLIALSPALSPAVFLLALPAPAIAQEETRSGAAPVLRGGVDVTRPPATVAPGGGPGTPGNVQSASRALGRCQLLLRNVLQAWQLTPDNVAQCHRFKGEAQGGGAAAGSCWATAQQAIALLERAYSLYLEADRQRHSPSSGSLNKQALALTRQARPLVEQIGGCANGLPPEEFHASPVVPTRPVTPVRPPVQMPGNPVDRQPGPTDSGDSIPRLPGGVRGQPCPEIVYSVMPLPRNGAVPTWRDRLCYYVARGNELVMMCQLEWNEQMGRCTFSDPGSRDTPERPGPRTPPPPPPPSPEGDYWAGVRAGLVDCSLGVQTMVEAFAAMARGDFVSAARQLHMDGDHAALRALWKDISETPVLDTRGRRLTDFEIGRRQAARLCLYAMVPAAQNCVLRGTACAARAATTSCGPLLGRLTQLRGPFGKLPFGRTPRPPAQRGLLPQDHQFLSGLAVSDNLIIVLRDSNAAAIRWIGRPGFAPKPQFLKAKTLKDSDLAHLPPARRAEYAGLVSAKDMTLGEIEHIRQAGFEIGSAQEQYVIRSANGTRYFSDADLHGIYHADGTPAWTNTLASKINCGMRGRMVQHPPHDQWAQRNMPEVAGSNAGPQVGNGKSLTALLPDGRALSIETLGEMKSLYEAIGVDFNSLYPGH
jgi:hypothetical protein